MTASSYIVLGFSILPMILTIIGNTVFFITLLKTSSLHKPSNVLLGALCITDLLVGVLCQPLNIVIVLSNLPVVPCCPPYVKAYNFIFWLSSSNSFVLSLLITLDRYVAIRHPYRYLAIATCRKHTYIVFGASILCLIFAIVHLMAFDNFVNAMLPIEVGFQLLVIMIVLIVYARIYKVVLSQRSRVGLTVDSQQSRISLIERSKTHTVTIILAAFIVCYAPKIAYTVKSILFYRGKIAHDRILGDWANYFVLLNSCLNPIIYCARSQEIRKAAVRIFISRSRLGPSSMNVAANEIANRSRRIKKDPEISDV